MKGLLSEIEELQAQKDHAGAQTEQASIPVPLQTIYAYGMNNIVLFTCRAIRCSPDSLQNFKHSPRLLRLDVDLHLYASHYDCMMTSF